MDSITRGLFDILLNLTGVPEEDFEYVSRKTKNTLIFRWKRDAGKDMVFIWDNENKYVIATRKAVKV